MSLFSIGLSGINAAQSALTTTSNNINNAFTPGYNREEVQLTERKGVQGVQVDGVQRRFDRHIAIQLNTTKSDAGALESYQARITQLDNLLADREVGLAPAMQKFFGSLGGLTSAPSDTAARQEILSTAQTLSGQFRSTGDYLKGMQQEINTRIGNEVALINDQAKRLAQLNRDIGLAAAKSGEAPNKLLNQRDKLVGDLSERLSVKLSVQDGNSYQLSLPDGKSLVVGSRVHPLEAMASPSDPQRTVVGYRDGGGQPQALDRKSFGGQLGGLLRFREESLDKTQNRLGQIAVTLAQNFNAVHASGSDLSGEEGQAFFALGEPRFSAYRDNKGASIDKVTVTDTQALRATDYEVRIVGDSPDNANGFTILRKDTGQTLKPDEDYTFDSVNRSLSVGGVEISFAQEVLKEGDRFEIQPLRGAAERFTTEVRDPEKIAAAGQGEASGDNSNALKLQDLQDASLIGGSTSLSQAYGQLIGEVGRRTQEIQSSLEAKQGMAQQLSAIQQAESGVNLNEEAVNLLKYQQFYQANAKVIEIGSTVLDTILGLRS